MASAIPAPTQDASSSIVLVKAGTLIVNADDWGRDRENTDRILDCVTIGTVSSTSAMVFMEDSRRAADVALDQSVDCGLHLNFTTPFNSPDCPSALKEHQSRIIRYLRGSRFAQVIFHPGLVSSFQYVTAAQIDEFQKTYGNIPRRFDGHHHMHLCANVILGRLVPSGVIVRRNFSFRASEKSGINRLYRGAIDSILAKRQRLTDYFFSLPPLEPRSRIDEICSIARRAVVEVETHPVNREEHQFLMGGEFLRIIGNLQIAKTFAV